MFKLYVAKGSNSSQRVEWAFNYKNIPYQRIEVTSKELTSSYLSVNPFGYVPCLSIKSVQIYESMAILEYVEEVFESDSLLGTAADERAQVRFVCEYVNSSIHSPQNRRVLKYLRPELTENDKKILRGDWIIKCLDVLRGSIFQHSHYAVGKRFTLADIFVASIYKKALQHGCAEHDLYHHHLQALRQVTEIAESEPA